MPAWGSPGATQPIESIRTAVQDFLSAELDRNQENGATGFSTTEIEVGSLDPRLALNHCGQRLSAFLSPGARLTGKTTVGVRCEGRRPWTIYIPVNIVSTLEVVVATKALQRGHLLTAGDLEIVKQTAHSPSDAYVSALDQALGLEVKQRVSQGSKIRIDMLKKPNLVKKGQRVTIHSTAKGLHVSSAGIAMSNGSEGARIRVKNIKSARIVEGVVQADGAIDTSH